MRHWPLSSPVWHWTHPSCVMGDHPVSDVVPGDLVKLPMAQRVGSLRLEEGASTRPGTFVIYLVT